MASRSRVLKPAAALEPGGYLLTITWEITGGMSVERAAVLCARDAAKAIPEVRRRRPVEISATPIPERKVTP